MENSPFYRWTVVIACLVIIVAGMRSARSLVVMLLLASFLTILLTTLLHWFQNKGVPRSIATLTILVAVTVLGSGLVLLVGKSFNDFLEKFPDYQAKIEEETEPILSWLQENGMELPGGEPDSTQDPVETPDTDVTEDAEGTPIPFDEDATSAGFLAGGPFDFQSLFSFARGLLTSIGNVLTNVFIIIITIAFMLIEASGIKEKLVRAFGKNNRTLDQVNEVVNNMRRYIVIKTVTSALTGVMVTAALTVLGVDYAVLFGLISFLLNFVPNIGSFVAAIPAVAVALLQGGVGFAALTVIVFVAINCTVSYIIEPKYMGKGLGLSPLVVFLSLLFWGWVLGPIGMLLSAPLTMTVRIGLSGNENTRWIAILMSGNQAEEAPTAMAT